MPGRNRPSQPESNAPAHERNAALAREIVNQRDPMGNPRDMREIALLKANALATLGVYELLKAQGAAPRD